MQCPVLKKNKKLTDNKKENLWNAFKQYSKETA